MKLLLLPGAGSPDNPLYASVYRLLKAEAPYDTVDSSIRWPGHNAQGVLTLDSAMACARSKIAALEADGQPYDFLARSFGCSVAVKIAMEDNTSKLRKVILWGPPPYWLLYEFWVRNFDVNCSAAKAKGVQVDQMLFSSLEPIECTLPLLRHDTVVGSGALDPFVTPDFLRYLESIVRQRQSANCCQSIRFKTPVPGAVHEVAEDAPAPVIEAYLQALFE